MLPRFAMPHLTDEAVAAYADGALASGPFNRAQQHLAECTGCSTAVRDQRAARFMLQAAIAPAVPGSLLERLRQLPTTEPTGGLPIGALSVDGQPMFAAFDTRLRMESATTVHEAADAPSAPKLPAPGESMLSPRRRPQFSVPVPVLGVSAAALIVGALAGTASAAGGATARPASPIVRPTNAVQPVNQVPASDLGAVTTIDFSSRQR